jgi:hypothetical protein
VASRREARARLAQAMPAKALPWAQEATGTGGLCLGAIAPQSNSIVLAQEAHARDHDPWQALMEQARADLHCQVLPSTSEAAPGLLASVDHPLGAHHAPALCPGPPELGKAVCGPLATKPRAAGKAAPEAHARREPGQGPLQGAGDAPHTRGPGRSPQAPARLEQMAQDAQAARQACERLSAQRAQVPQRLRRLGQASHWVAVERGGRRATARA